MDLREKIQTDLHEALKNSEERKLSILRLLLDGIIKKEKDKRAGLKDIDSEEELVKKSQLTDEEVLQVISSFVKKSREATEQFEAGGRQELADKEKREMEILNQYLPEQMPEQMPEGEVRKLIEQAIKEVNAESIKEMGKVMSVLMPKIQGKADGSTVSSIVKQMLTK
ncbi:MAG: GatB/YqeY domain-containing protein [Candidatus Parcubacteria bacterium]|nr:GatB/YqeY domain-containing protein [Candidatus Parcubacteria bacterium]